MIVPTLEENSSVDPCLLSLSDNVLELLKDAINSVSMPPAKKDKISTIFRSQTLLYFAKKVYRITKAGITLARTCQTTQALTLKRDQHYAMTAFSYYLTFERESVLFFASGPLRQRDSAVEIMKFEPSEKSNPKRIAQLKELTTMADSMYKQFPGLKVAKGKSGKIGNPLYQDWKEPDEHTMMKAIVETWPDEMAKIGSPIPEDEKNSWIDEQLRSAQFFHAKYPSQDIHNTPMGLVFDLNAETDYSDGNINLDAHNANGLINIYLGYAIDVSQKLVTFSGVAGFKDRLIKIEKAAHVYSTLVDL